MIHPDREYIGPCIYCNTPLYFDHDQERVLPRGDSWCVHQAEREEDEDAEDN